MTDEEFRQNKKIIEDSFAKAGALYREASPQKKVEYKQILAEALSGAFNEGGHIL